MIVLGISRGHDAGACLMRDGQILCVVEAERVHQIKHCDGPGSIPESVRVALENSGVSADQIDRVVIADSYRDNIELSHPALVPQLHSEGLMASVGTANRLLHLGGGDLGIRDLRPSTPVFATCHHACHAAGAVYMSGFERCLSLVYDGYGICCGTIFYHYDGRNLARVEASVDRMLVGWRYQMFAQFVREIDKEKTAVYDFAGKIMGLNAYGNPDKSVVAFLKGWLREDKAHYDLTWDTTSSYWFPGLVNERGFGRNQSSVLDPDYLCLLASLQIAIDEVVCEEIAAELTESDSGNLVLSGGCAFNILTNDAVAGMSMIKSSFIPPNAGDVGLAMGAAIIGSQTKESGLHFPNVSAVEKRSPYKGPFLLGRRLEGDGLNEATIERIVKSLSEGGIVGFVKDRMEIGPRALGHRSLLADATHSDMREIINQRIKGREWWRPFAPVARSVDADEYFEIKVADPYMLHSAIVRPEWRDRLRPVTHKDFSARLQVLADEAAHPELWAILTELKRRTGVGVCLNTSLNIGGYPIMNSLSEIQQFLSEKDVDFIYVDGAILEPVRAKTVRRLSATGNVHSLSPGLN